jgi:hypothetical protein
VVRRAGIAALVAAALLGACGTGRSVEAYCDTYSTRGEEFRQRYLTIDAEADPLGAFAQLAAAPRDLATLFSDLAEVAPEEIRADVETLRDHFDQQADQLGDDAGALLDGPWGALGVVSGDLLAGLSVAPALQRFDRWTNEHCGAPPA